MIFAKLEVRKSTQYYDATYVQRQPGGKLCLVRKKKSSPAGQSRGAIEVLGNLPQHCHVAAHSAESKEKHHHPQCIDQSKLCRDNIHIEVTEDQAEPKQRRISIAIGFDKHCPTPTVQAPSPVIEVREPCHAKAEPKCELRKVRVGKEKHCPPPAPRALSPIIEVREPRHVKAKPHDELEEVRPAKEQHCPRTVPQAASPIIEVREPRHVKANPHIGLKKVRLEKVKVEKLRRRDIPPSAHFEIHRVYRKEHVNVKLPAAKPQPQPEHMPEDERVTWDAELQAWVVKRAPRVRFG